MKRVFVSVVLATALSSAVLAEDDLYVRLAKAYLAECRAQGSTRPSLLKGKIGVLPMTFRLSQVTGPDTALVHLRDSDGFSNSTYWIEGVDMRSEVDDRDVNFGDLVFVRWSTKTYTTVMGGSKTVRILRCVSGDDFDAAVERVRGEEAATLQKLKDKAAIARGNLGKFDKDNRKTAEAIVLVNCVRNLRLNPGEGSAAQIKAMEEKLGTLGTPTESEIQAYKTNRAELISARDKADTMLKAGVWRTSPADAEKIIAKWFSEHPESRPGTSSVRSGASESPWAKSPKPRTIPVIKH